MVVTCGMERKVWEEDTDVSKILLSDFNTWDRLGLGVETFSNNKSCD